MMTATAALEHKTVTLQTQIKDTGTLQLDKRPGQDRRRRPQGHGLDDVRGRRRLLAQRRRREGRARARQDHPRSRRRSSTTRGSSSASAAPTGIDVAGEVSGIVRDPGLTPWAQIDLANGVVRPGRRGHPDPARDRVRRADERRDARSSRTSSRRSATQRGRARAARPGHRHGPLDGKLVGLMNHVVTTVPSTRAGRSCPGTRSAARPGPPRSGTRGARRPGRLEAQPLQLLVRRLHRPRAAACPDLVVAIRIEEGQPTVARVGQLEMPVMSFQLFRRIATDAITTPGPADRSADHHRARRRTGDRGPWDTPRRDRRRPVAAASSADARRDRRARAHRRRARPPDRRPPARPLGPADPRRRRGLARGPARAWCSWPCPVSGPTATPTWPRPWPPGRRRCSSPARRPTRRRSATSRSSASPMGSPRSGRSPPAGVAGSTRSSSGSPAASPRPRPRRPSPRSSARRFRTLKSAGNQNNEIGLPLTVLAARPGARGGRPRDGDVRRRRDRRPGPHRAAVDRRRDRGPGRPPVADRVARGDRGRQGRARRGAPGRRARPSSTPTTRSSAGWPRGPRRGR